MGDKKRENAIRILITGGTVEKEYDPLTGELTFARFDQGDIVKIVK